MTIYADSPDIAERVIKAHKIKIIDDEKYCPAGKIMCDHVRYDPDWDEKICINLGKRVELLYGCPDISKHKKPIKEKKMSTILCVASLIAKTPCKFGVANHVVAAADPLHPLSGLQRLRELAKRCHLTIGCKWPGWAYYYDHNRYYPTAAFKRFCAKFVKERS